MKKEIKTSRMKKEIKTSQMKKEIITSQMRNGIIKICILLLIIPLLIENNTYNVSAKVNEVTQRKIVYLTFDDGPSPNNTDAILDILAQNNVKATFCVVGHNALRNPRTMKRIYNLNMGLIPHCNNHEYAELYSSTQYYMDDLEKCIKAINSSIGEERKYSIIRMPGGSDNSVCSSDVLWNIKCELKNRNINYLDWSIDSGDASASKVATAIIEDNINKQAGNHKVEVILMHDLENKITTRNALQDIINKYKELGYEFKTFNEIEKWEIDYLINNHVINK